ncbi:uncharacterized protein LOC135814525 [Sycon ciliatum]|uniref:uncharacterized protein LOC135814525 n=1 Tax=Sycon ciliatum TaxID=27933 RepID=UPI0031F69430
MTISNSRCIQTIALLPLLMLLTDSIGARGMCFDEFVISGDNLYPSNQPDGKRIVLVPGKTETWKQCQSACVNGTTRCHSWTLFFENATQGLANNCYLRTDDYWNPQFVHGQKHLTVASGVNCKSPPATALPNAPPPNVQFSWDHVPVFIHTSNTTGPFNDQALQIMAKFPIVTIEKYQGPNSGYHYPAEKWVCCEEDRIVDTLKSVKKINPNITGIFYYNMVLDYPQYRLHENFAKNESWWLHDQFGNVVKVGINAGAHNTKDLLVYDTTQEAVSELFMHACLDLVPSGAVDGCFVDRPVDGLPHQNMTTDMSVNLMASHVTTLQAFQEQLKRGPLIANHGYGMPGVNAAMIEVFRPTEEDIMLLQWTADRGKLVEAHMVGGDCTTDEGIQDHLAAFLIGAGNYSYFGCGPWFTSTSIDSQWKASYDKPLGAPLGRPSKTKSVYTRKFASGTTVHFDCSTNKGTIDWAKSPEMKQYADDLIY